MEINLNSRYRSISPFEELSLPDFTVLVGLNGSGKSQLLEAIGRKNANCKLSNGPQATYKNSDISTITLTNASLKLNSEMIVNYPSSENFILPDQFEAHRSSAIDQLDIRLQNIIKGTKYENVPEQEFISLPRSEILAEIASMPNSSSKHFQLSEALNQINANLSDSYFDGYHEIVQQAIRRFSLKHDIEPRLVSFENASTFQSWGTHSSFNSHLPQLFSNYRREQVSNRRLMVSANRADGQTWLDDESFIAKFGAPPWEQLSDILETFGINYRVAAPGNREIDPIVLFFEHRDEPDTHVEFSSLSSGEQVLVILAVALLEVDPFRANIQKPQLLLLDEIDASLHPAVLHQWMKTISDKVVGEMGIACIMTTHSPITVALASETSLYEMTRNIIPISKITKNEALNKLTVGLPSMEVDFTQRRQVFVESDTDAEAYDKIHTCIKADFKIPRSLSFLSTGIRSKGGIEQGTGCSAVEKIVEELTVYGNLSTFGLLDWDGHRAPNGRVHIIAQSSHYSFDNIILNPLLIGMLLIRRGMHPDKNLPKFSVIDSLDNFDLQRIADSVQRKLQYPENSYLEVVSTTFLNERSVMVDGSFCFSNGHIVTSALDEAFPALKSLNQKRGQLAIAVINQVIAEFPGFCPKTITEAFYRLSCADP